jgi:hypothetical protein
MDWPASLHASQNQSKCRKFSVWIFPPLIFKNCNKNKNSAAFKGDKAWPRHQNLPIPNRTNLEQFAKPGASPYSRAHKAQLRNDTAAMPRLRVKRIKNEQTRDLIWIRPSENERTNERTNKQTKAGLQKMKTSCARHNGTENKQCYYYSVVRHLGCHS